MLQYRVPSFASPEELLQRIATSRGKLLPGGIADSQVRPLQPCMLPAFSMLTCCI